MNHVARLITVQVKKQVSQASAGDAVGRAFDAVETAWQNPGVLGGVPTGFEALDEILNGLQDSDLILAAARPSMGETAFAVNIARNASVNIWGIACCLWWLK